MSYFYTTPSPNQTIKFYKNQQYYNILPFQFLPYHYYLFYLLDVCSSLSKNQ